MTFDLGNIINASDVYAPPRILVYATHGLGKTTFGASFESPILLRVEDGASAVDVATFPRKAESYADLCACMRPIPRPEKPGAGWMTRPRTSKLNCLTGSAMAFRLTC